MSAKMFRKVNKKSRRELDDVSHEIVSLTIKLTEYTRVTLNFIREILTYISRISGPFWFHIPNSLLEVALCEITILFTNISDNLGFPFNEETRVFSNYEADTMGELNDVINGQINTIMVTICNQSNNIKNETLKEKTLKDVNYAINVLLDLKTNLKEGMRRLSALYV